ncbi:hypothetical protein HDA32_004998 [Spinactinospora alkalitolerans]|uniref:DUF320 domain-containing protein n=1 Tax=Spinactinospora alkalitolerans TaxID=687207 RepID=A0A852U0Y8_9ACTN|nr:hypothetical protein [Spinactinospora alkalitolerans]NYE49878.1 hypothetical protein [Spinactinospora alkalitolerans]
MPREPTAAGLIAGAVLGLVLTAAPAQAHEQPFDQNLQIAPVQVCNAEIVAVPALSPQTTGECVNGPDMSLSSDEAMDAVPERDGGKGADDPEDDGEDEEPDGYGHHRGR